jgi:CelD/BcsL family acetyltransferase involved in cellulose biosynthesis
MSEPTVTTRLERLSPEHIATSGWPELFAAQPEARFYQHPDWLLAASTHLLDTPLELACVYHDEALVLLLPLQARAQRHRFNAPSHDHLTLGDILIAPSLNEAERKSALAQALALAGNTQWDWQIGNLPQRSALSSCTQDQPGWEQRESRQSAWFDLQDKQPPGSGKLRRNLKRLRSKLQEQGQVHAQWLTGADELQEALGHFLALEASGWKGEEGQATAIAANPALQGFYQQLLTPQFTGLQPVICLLWLDEQCIAAQFGLQTDDCLSLLKIAYDENYSQFSPGSLLLQDTADHAMEQDLATLSLVTAPPWAERWHPLTEPVWHLTHYANNPGGQALRTLNRLKQTAKARLKPAA